MHLTSFSAWNFRSFDEILFNASKGMVLFMGPNGSGKTNALEGIYYSLTGKSFRTRRDADLISFDRDFFRTEAEYVKDGLKKKASVGFQVDQSRIVSINGKECSKASQLFYETFVVVFSPGSSSLIKGSPGTRRHFLDRINLKINPEYSLILSKYNQTLKSRNTILKNHTIRSLDHDLYQLLTDEIIRYSKVIQTEREKMLHLFNQQLEETREACPLPGAENISWKYQPFDFRQDSFHHLLNQETKKRVSLIGAHLDQIEVECNHRLAKDFSSEGEIKVMTIFTKLCEFQTLEKHTKITPILIMDDLSSELDESNLTKVLHFVSSKTQVFLSSINELPSRMDICIPLEKFQKQICYR